MCCVHNGILPEEELETYKKEYMSTILKHIEELQEQSGNKENVSEDDIQFDESETNDEV